MKKFMILFLSLLLASCQTAHQQQKEFYQPRSRTYQKPYDSVLKKVVEFTVYSKAQSQVVGITPGLVLIDETFNDEQAFKYTDYDPKKCAFNVLESKERLVIYIKSDSSNTIVDIKSFIKSSVAYYNYSWKAVERVNADIECASTGTREKELLDFISGNKF